jgi:hypothetical protein
MTITELLTDLAGRITYPDQMQTVEVRSITNSQTSQVYWVVIIDGILGRRRYSALVPKT